MLGAGTDTLNEAVSTDRVGALEAVGYFVPDRPLGAAPAGDTIDDR